MSTKRVILANGSRLFREMLRRVINKADNLEVVQEIPSQDDLALAIERFDPEWVILSSRYSGLVHGWLSDCVEQYPSVRFIVVSPDHTSIKLKSRAAAEQDLTNLSLNDFIHILEKDLQHT